MLSKRPLIENAPEGYTEHVRDPKPYFTEDGKIRFYLWCTARKPHRNSYYFEMDNLEDTPRLLGELSLPAFDNKNVFMWECPDLLKIGDKDVFIWSPQGKDREAHQFQNNYHATYAVGKLTDLTFEAEYIGELDQGFDFYAPQTFASLDNQTHAVLFGWIGLPDLTYPTDKFKWHSALTLPRELRLEDSKIYQRPIDKIYENLTALSALHLDKKENIANLDRAYLKFEVNNQAFDLNFFQNEKGQSLRLSYENGLVCLDRSQSEQTELMEKFDTNASAKLKICRLLKFFFDRSIIEIFFNHGEKAMTSRFFIENRKNTISSSRPLDFTIGYLPAIHYDK